MLKNSILLFALLSASVAAGQSTRTQPRVPALVSIPSSYPAFEPRPGAAPLRAIVRLHDPQHGDSSFVLLNPAYANPATLYEALSIVRRFCAEGGAGPRYVALGLTAGVREPEAGTIARLQAVLRRLEMASDVAISGRRVHGRVAAVPDVWQFFETR
jgi:hypothetical protein